MGKFTEDDAKDLAAFANFVSKNAKFNLDWADSIVLAKYSQFLQQLVVKIKEHVIELEKVVEPSKDNQQNKKPNKGKK